MGIMPRNENVQHGPPSRPSLQSLGKKPLFEGRVGVGNNQHTEEAKP